MTLVWPEHDRLVARPPWLPDNVRNVTLPDAGHIPMWDAPDAVAEILLAATAEPSAVRSVASLRRSAVAQASRRRGSRRACDRR